VLSADYLTIPDQMIRKIESVLTLLGGRVVLARRPFEELAKAT
jgi:predicted amidohydrolase YtcJ